MLYILGGLLLLLALVLLVPVGVRVSYTSDGGDLLAKLYVMGIPFTLYPRPEKEESESADKPAAEKSAKKQKTGEEAPKKTSPFSFKEQAQALKQSGLPALLEWVQALAGIVGKAAKRLLRAFTVTRLDLRIALAGEDAAETALAFGKTCAVLYPALGMVESGLRVRRQQIEVKPAFCAEETAFSLAVRVHIAPWRVVWAGLCLAVSYIFMPKVGEPSPAALQDNKEAV